MDDFIFFDAESEYSAGESFIAAIGVFDGVHTGHRKIIETAAALAKEHHCRVLALSFSPHPRALLCPDQPPELLVSEKSRCELLRDAGADICGFINFTSRAAALSPEDFLLELRDHAPVDICGIIVGNNWKFGRNGSGNRNTLEKFCSANRWFLNTVEEVTLEDRTVSSTAIRGAIASGFLPLAVKMLGRNISLAGTVTHGFQIAGSKLEAPTANLDVKYGVLPPDGVYSGCCTIDGILYPAAVNIGLAPTFGNGLRRVEIHLLDFKGSLYDREITLEINSFIRPERRFASPEELKAQIAADIAAIRRTVK